ncbi:hypothetical protein CKM354_001174800 [Cercospora kikuchii]|uniref:Integral membrane protein n=1 Tax=Cercospora kikuchii TaxID=84275 RepID=A0A9P3CTL6_9PEZI|nr:uncharacterized protein CKM354_001174800 [Cercospora kikuchii]GIZ48698.1 hypothetical protein CKM354_001174800 [Cercospora kikuchii]
MENFDNPDPFAKDEVQQRSQHAAHDAEEPRTSRRDYATSPPAAANKAGGRSTSRSTRKSSKRAQSTTSTSGEHPHLDKFKTAVDDVQAGVVDKVRTFGHKLHFDSVHAHGVSRFLNPTTIRMKVRYQIDSDFATPQEETSLLWRARDNRKGRNSIAVPRLPVGDDEDASFLPLRYTPRMSSKISDIAHNLYRMATTFPYWDMSFWSGASYTIGSALFVADGALAWGPVAFGVGFETASADKLGGPLCFFIGALFYQVGAVAAYLEAVNDGSFHGAAMRRLLDGHEEDSKKLLDEKVKDFFGHVKPRRPHRNPDTKMPDADPDVDPEAGWRTKEDRLRRPGSIYPQGKSPAPRRGGVDLGGDESLQGSVWYSTWRWWPTWKALRSHHVYEIGYLACAIQLFGVTLYGVTAVVILPGILTSLKPWQELAAFWIPQVVAALCFLIASLMFMLETQEKWWKPEPGILGWWIGVWSTAGSVGFELIACFGIQALASGEEAHWAEYQSDLATMWGSACYFIGSFLQWYEALNKNPIEELFNEPGEMKSSRVHPI